MKNPCDVWLLSKSFAFDNVRLARVIFATIERPGTAMPMELPDALNLEFVGDEQKPRQWNAFLENVALDRGSLGGVIAPVSELAMP